MKLLIAIHGILQKLTAPGWVDELDAWSVANMPDVKVIKKEYHAGPFPRLNCFWKDPILARQIAAEVALFTNPDLYFVSHSNGGVIALKAIQLLAARGIPTRAAIFVQAALPSDVEKNGVLELTQPYPTTPSERVGLRGLRIPPDLGRAIAWSNAGDQVVHFHGLKRLLGWPYGSLGHDGWTLNGQRFTDGTRIFTRWTPKSWGHTGCWSPERRGQSFEQIHQTLCSRN